MVGQDAHGFASSKIPHANVAVERACYDLGVGLLANEAAHCLRVSAQYMAVAIVSQVGRHGRRTGKGDMKNSHVAPGPHIPYPRYTVTSARHQDIERRM